MNLELFKDILVPKRMVVISHYLFIQTHELGLHELYLIVLLDLVLGRIEKLRGVYKVSLKTLVKHKWGM